ncbi:MAG: hypothetical protein HXX10_07780 [Rhodoplanes sp.]|nr:hypothetical protein [Rhodoplanes sp.]
MGYAPVLPGFEVTSVTTGPRGTSITQRPEAGGQFDVPDGHTVKGVSALVDPEGRERLKWIKTREGDVSVQSVIEWAKESMIGYEPHAAPAPAPEHFAGHLLTLVPLADLHVGLYAWKRDAGANWDLKKAEADIGGALEDVVRRTPPGGEAIVLGGGDLIHSDNNDNTTAKSGNALQVDGRYQKIVMVANRIVVRTADACLRRHQHVTIRILPGNHDEHAAIGVAYFLLAWYRHEPRVTVDVDPGLFWWFRFGAVLLGATHGHTVKIDKMPSIMAHRRPADWGATTHRYVHGFHLHHSAKFATEGEGVISEIHQAPVPQDAWHYGAGFLSGRSVQAITYHHQHGEIGRVRVAMLDAAEEPAT